MLPRLHRPLQLKAISRAFSSTAPALALNVSNVGKRPITIPPSVTITPAGDRIAVTGPLGTTSVWAPPYLVLNFAEPQTLHVAVQDPAVKQQRAWWGTTRTLIENAIVGMTEGFSTPLYLVGVGYRAAMEADPLGVRPGWTGQRLNMKLGFSHSVFVPIPDHVKVVVESPTKIVLSCTDKIKLGQFAAQVRKWRVPEPYKGKVCCSHTLVFFERLFTVLLPTGYIRGYGESQNQVGEKEVAESCAVVDTSYTIHVTYHSLLSCE